jgi:hypothetical protein
MDRINSNRHINPNQLISTDFDWLLPSTLPELPLTPSSLAVLPKHVGNAELMNSIFLQQIEQNTNIVMEVVVGDPSNNNSDGRNLFDS